MAYSLNTLNGSADAPSPRTGVGRFAQEVTLVLGLALLIFVVMAFLSYSPQDAAWSTSGAGGP
ncbi:MAG: DNA translocase FtsK 4TM domain-containing protein, partial [Ottowia sp.]|nr:DNA translocase FtsK 4TM domain-containing protein [Ottowia sp.]